MRMLGIECTAHTFGVAWTDGNEILQFNDTYKPPAGQGFIPRDLSEHHCKIAPELIRKINESGKEYDAICFSQGPGIGQALQSGAALARYLSLKQNKPIYGVNHCAAHLEIGVKDTGFKDPLFVYASGGNTQIISRVLKNKKTSYRVLGETLDVGLGNAFDMFARQIGLNHGGDLEKIANGSYIELPYSVKGMNLTFSGLLTAAFSALEKNAKEDVVYSFMHTSFSMVSETVERALCLTKKDGVVVVGGVAQNNMFKKMLSKICDDQEVSFCSPANEFNRDNAGMIAYTGWLVSKNNKPLKMDKIVPLPYWRTDEVLW
ncbi:UGMP family protein [Candidatus Micrarchaeota archaeon]|nr:UGMP family protein [Candidatus Micrarchaeota archaeon]